MTATNAIRVIKFGDMVELECTVYGDSSISIDWDFNGSAYNGTDSSYNSTDYSLSSSITLSSVDDADDGNYTCSHGQDSSLSQEFKLDVYSKSTFSKNN